MNNTVLQSLLRIEHARQPLNDRTTLPNVLDCIAQEMQACLAVSQVVIWLRDDLFDPPLPLTITVGTSAPAAERGAFDLAWAGVTLGQVQITLAAAADQHPLPHIFCRFVIRLVFYIAIMKKEGKDDMPKMIILISDQRMQNLIPMLQKGANYSHVILVLSKDRRTDKSLQRFRDSANDLKCVLGSKVETDISDKLVDPYDIKQVAETMGILLKEVGTDTVINISGGTKPMAIGALQAAQSVGIDCVYTNTEDMELIWLSPDGSTQHEPIQVEGLDIPLYIRAYGEEVTTSQEVSDFSADQKAWAATIVEQHEHIYQKVIKPVTDAIKDARGNYPADCSLAQSVVTRRRREIIAQLATQGLWQWDEQSLRITIPDKARAAFLNGGWVELCVAHLLEQSGFEQVLLNVKLKDFEGEIDVIAIHNGKLLLVECKSNTQLSVQLNKLDGFRRRLGGTFAQAYYARASEAYKKRINQQCQKIKLDKAFFGPELQHIGREISFRIGVSRST